MNNDIGTYNYLNGDKYEGSWKDQKRNGIGTCYYTNKEKYDGEWANNMKNGHGKFERQN